MGVVVDKDTGGKMFYVRRDKETGEVIMTEHDEIKQVRNWKPVPIETYEAAIILIRGTGTKKTKENPYDAAKVGPAVGEKVRIKEGIYQFLEGAVTKIDGTNYTVETVLMGRQVKVQANKLQLEIVK
jgi:transcription antitermination factor NusG